MGGNGVADAAAVFIEGEVTTIVQAVLYRPVASDELCEPAFISLLGQETRETVSYFVSSRTVRQNDFALHSEDLSGVREVDLLGFNRACYQAT